MAKNPNTSTLVLITQFALALFISFQSITLHASNTEVKTSQADFENWLANFKRDALQQGISAKTLNTAFSGVKLNSSVLKSDKSQPEFTQTFFAYFNRAVSKYRIENGQKYYKEHKQLLDKVTQKYGVPGRFVVAFWGMETNYGSYTGNIPIIESLATLAYDPRRSGFFTTQLMSALTILDKGHVKLEQMKGSWAGAMGQVQFMPSNYLKYAVDGDGDGKINLWDSLPDAFFSAGNFLNHLGWQAEKNWGREVKLPIGFNFAMADNETKRPLSEWRNLGIKLAGGRYIPYVDIQAKLLLMTDYKGPAFLVYDNFKVIKRWNNANKYAIAVGHLADRIVKRPALTKQAPKNDKSLSRSQIKQLQKQLNALDFQTGKPDGIAGSKTRSALRAFQVANELPADGFPNLRMLKLVEKAYHVQS